MISASFDCHLFRSLVVLSVKLLTALSRIESARRVSAIIECFSGTKACAAKDCPVEFQVTSVTGEDGLPHEQTVCSASSHFVCVKCEYRFGKSIRGGECEICGASRSLDLYSIDVAIEKNKYHKD